MIKLIEIINKNKFKGKILIALVESLGKADY